MKAYFDRIFTGTADAFSLLADTALLNQQKMFIVTANPEILMQAEKDPAIGDMLLQSDTTVIPDGISVVKAMQSSGYDVKERITGVDLAEHLLHTAGKNSLSVYLLGAAEDVVSTLAKKMKLAYPKMTIQYKNGYDGDKDEIFEKIKQAQPDLILVALGAPAQDMLIQKHIADFEKGVFIGVGGSFDVLSGKKKRAPKLFIRTNTEWLYRILREPSRLKRFYDSNVKFMRYVSGAERNTSHESKD